MIGTVMIMFAGQNIGFPWQEMNVVGIIWKCYFFLSILKCGLERERKGIVMGKKKKRKKITPLKIYLFSVVMFAMCFGSWEINFLFLRLSARVTQIVPGFSPVFQWHRSLCSPVS